MKAVTQPSTPCAVSFTTIVVVITVLPLLIFTSQEKLVKHMFWESIFSGGALALLILFVLLILVSMFILCIVRNNEYVATIAALMIILLVFAFSLIVYKIGYGHVHVFKN